MERRIDAVGRGYAKLHREIENHPTFSHDGIFRLWTYCILRANWKDSQWMIPGTTTSMVVRRGQFITGRESLYARLYGPDYRGEYRPVSRTLWRWLESLAAMGCIKMDNVSNRCTLVTVCNYETYQGEDDTECPAAVPPVSSQCPADVPPVSTDKERQEGKKGRKKEALPPLPAFIDTPEMQSALVDWLDYKAEKGDRYKPRGLKAFISRVETLSRKHGVVPIIDAMHRAMASNWQGWEHDIGKENGDATAMARPLTEDEFDTWNPIDGGGA